MQRHGLHQVRASGRGSGEAIPSGGLQASLKWRGRCGHTSGNRHNAYVADPCVLCPHWYAHCAKFGSVESLVSLELKAKASMHADNIDVDMGNTIIHKPMRPCLQQTLANIADAGAQFDVHSDKAFHTDVLSASTYGARPVKDKTSDKQKIRVQDCGGGGLDRAFVSHLALTRRLPSGKLDPTTIWQQCRQENAQAHLPLLESMREGARLVTLLEGTRKDIEHVCRRSGEDQIVESFATGG